MSKHIVAIITDDVDGKRLQITIDVSKQGIAIGAKGYGEKTAEPGTGRPIFIDFFNDELRVHVWADINKEDQTHIIDMSGALESKYVEEQSK